MMHECALWSIQDMVVGLKLQIMVYCLCFLLMKMCVSRLNARIGMLLIFIGMKLLWSANCCTCCLLTVTEGPVSRPTVHSYKAWSQFNSWCISCRTHGITSGTSSQVRIKVHFVPLYPIFTSYHSVQVFVPLFPTANLKLFMKPDMNINCQEATPSFVIFSFLLSLPTYCPCNLCSKSNTSLI